MNMNWLNTNYILRAGVLSVLLLLPGLISATCKADTIINSYKDDSLRFIIKDDSIITFRTGDSIFTIIRADSVLPVTPKQVKHSRYDNRIHRFRSHWERIIPTHSKIQYAGNMGLLSFGTGWDYGKHNQWETDILLGFIPKYSSKKAKVTMTLKQNYMPWSINIGKGFSTEPLTCGLYVNTVFGDQFWVNEPERYPKGYYGFSSKVRFHVFMGQRLTYDIDPQRRFLAKSVTFFYEISTCDLYVISAVNPRTIVKSAKAVFEKEIATTPKSGTVSVKNQGKGALSVDLITRTQLLNDTLPAISDNLRMDIRYANLNGTPLSVNDIIQGTDFMAITSISNISGTSDYTNLALTHIIPSGWEIYNERMVAPETENAAADGSGQSVSKYSYQDIRDDRVLTYFNLRRGETKVFTVRLQATYAGNFILPAVQCEAMYDVNVQARSKAGRTTVSR